MYEYKATYISNYDGDTIKFNVQLGFNISFKITVRLYGINTPELRDKDEVKKSKAYQAKYFVQEALMNASSIILITYKDRKGKYGRYLADVIYNDINLNQKLLEEGLAAKY